MMTVKIKQNEMDLKINKINNCDKKRKTTQKNIKNNAKTIKYDNFPTINKNKLLLDEARKTNLIVYIKTLLEAYKSLPNIIHTIDKIIENRASTLPTSYIYGDSYLATYRSIDKVIDLGERKNKLLNLYVMIEKLLDSLIDKDRKIIILKYVKKCTTEEIAEETKSVTRTIYRRINSTLEKLATNALKNNWTSYFIKTQIGNEPWLEEIFNEKLKKELKLPL